MKIKNVMWMSLLLAGMMAAPLFAAKPKPKVRPSNKMSEGMAKSLKVGSPNENHKVLEPFVGIWETEIRVWIEAGEPKISKGNSTIYWTHGDRFLKQEYLGDYAGIPFEASAYIGYDNIRKEYQSVWMNNFASGMMIGSGTYHPETQTLTQSGTFSSALADEPNRPFRSELKMIDHDNYIYTSTTKNSNGKEIKDIEIVYTRVK